MNRAEALRLIRAVADNPPSEIRKVERRTGLPRGVLPAPEAAELRMRGIRARLDITKGRRPALHVNKPSMRRALQLGGQ